MFVTGFPVLSPELLFPDLELFYVEVAHETLGAFLSSMSSLRVSSSSELEDASFESD
jgi:hypothetical protein